MLLQLVRMALSVVIENPDTEGQCSFKRITEAK